MKTRIRRRRINEWYGEITDRSGVVYRTAIRRGEDGERMAERDMAAWLRIREWAEKQAMEAA